MTLPLLSNGPDRFRGGTHCPDHHDGIRTGFPDWCCCCEPCLYVRPSEGRVLADLGLHSCRCVPRILCATFTPDIGSDPCAKPIQSWAVPVLSQGESPATITYGFGFDIQITIRLSVWRFYSVTHSVDESFTIDHVTTTCLQVPPLTLTGVVVGGVTGSVSFAEYSSSKIPFINRGATPETEAAKDVLYGLTNCTTAAARLCVNGRRHVSGPIEQVEFVWDEGLQDRWEYLPPFGDPTTNREVIYLRSDESGNPYLELDFEQTGGDTNDWADPPTSDGDVLKMLAINACTCEMFVQSETTGSRYVTITGGRCAEYHYLCGACRCVPTYLCYFGMVDGEIIQGRATWSSVVPALDGGDVPDYGWVLDDYPDLILKLTTADSSLDSDTEPVRPCAIFLRDTASPGTDKTNKSNPIRQCGPYFSVELLSEPDAYGNVNWLYASPTICGSCAVSTCGPCQNNCGASPAMLYVDLRSIWNGPNDPDDPYFGVQQFCDLTVEVHYYQFWNTNQDAFDCGYFGISEPITCGDDVWVIKVISDVGGLNWRVSRVYVSGPVFDAYGPTGDYSGDGLITVQGEPLENPMKTFTFTLNNYTCEPLSWSGSPADIFEWSPWCCATLMDTIEVTIYE